MIVTVHEVRFGHTLLTTTLHTHTSLSLIMGLYYGTRGVVFLLNVCGSFLN